MTFIRRGSQAFELLTLLSVVGEFPNCSIHLLGRERVYKALVSKLTEKQTFSHTETGQKLTTKLLTISGKGGAKTVRLYRKALPILEWIGASEYYGATFKDHKFRGDPSHVIRNHRVAEATAMFMKAGLDIRPYRLEPLQTERILDVVEKPSFYTSRSLKGTFEVDMNKTMYTRIVGALFTESECYAVYNTRDAAMKWCGKGEFKTRQALTELSRLNAGIREVNSAILFGNDAQTALSTLNAAGEDSHKEYRFDSIYPHVHYVPLTQEGIRQLRFFLIPRWKEQLLEMLFDDADRSFDAGLFEYDAFVGDTYVLAHFDGDIARLIRYREGIENVQARHEVLCFPHQVSYLRQYLGDGAAIKTIDIWTLENEFDIGKEKDEI